MPATQDTATRHPAILDIATQDTAIQGTATQDITSEEEITRDTIASEPTTTRLLSVRLSREETAKQSISCFLMDRIPDICHAHLYTTIMRGSVIYARLCRNRAYRFVSSSRSPIRGLTNHSSDVYSPDGAQARALIKGALGDRVTGVAEEQFARRTDIDFHCPTKRLGELHWVETLFRHWPIRKAHMLDNYTCDGGCNGSFSHFRFRRLHDIQLRIVVNVMRYTGISATDLTDRLKDSTHWTESAKTYELESIFDPAPKLSVLQDLGQLMNRNISFMTAITRMAWLLLMNLGQKSIILKVGHCGARVFGLLSVGMYSSGAPSHLKVREVVGGHVIVIPHEKPIRPVNDTGRLRSMGIKYESTVPCSALRKRDAVWWPWRRSLASFLLAVMLMWLWRAWRTVRSCRMRITHK